MKSKKIIIIFSILLIIILIGGYFAIKYVKEKQGENTKSEEYIPQEEISEDKGPGTSAKGKRTAKKK